MKGRLGYTATLLYVGAVALSALAALAVGWPIRHGPPGPLLLVVGLVFGAGVIGALPASAALLGRRGGEPPTPMEAPR